MFDLVLLACKPPGSDLEEPLSFAISYFQAYAGAIILMRAYLSYSEDRLVKNLFHWSNVLRPDLGMTAKEFIKSVVAKFYEPQSLGGPQLIEVCIPLTWNQLSVEHGYSSECARKRSAARQWETIIDEINLRRPEDRPAALLPGDGQYPPNLNAHPSWACNSGRVVVERQQQNQAQHVHRVPMHPGQVPLAEVWGGNPWGSNDVEEMEPTPKATPPHGPKRSRTDGRADLTSSQSSQAARPDLTGSQSSQAASSSAAPPPMQPEQERNGECDWAEVPVPDGAAEYAFDFHKEDVQLCRGRLVHTLNDPDNYLFAYDETPLYKPNVEEGTLPIEHYVRRVVVYLGRLQSVTQNKTGGLNVQVFVKADTTKWLQMYARMYHGCGVGTCEHLPTPAMLTAAVLVKTEDDLKSNENDTFASASPDDKRERTNVLRAANEIRNSLAIGGKPDATLVRTQHTFLAMDFEMYANNKRTTFSLSEAFHNKGVALFDEAISRNAHASEL